MLAFPFLIYYLLGSIFNADLLLITKLGLLLVLFLLGGFCSRYFVDERLYHIIPIGLYVATKFWLFVTFIVYFLPCKDFLNSPHVLMTYSTVLVQIYLHWPSFSSPS